MYSRKSGQKLSQFFLLLCKTHTCTINPVFTSSLYSNILAKVQFRAVGWCLFKFQEYESVSSKEACLLESPSKALSGEVR